MASTWYSCGGPVTPESSHSSFVFNGISGTVEKVFFYFENVATRGKTSEERALELLGYLVGDAFDFYYEEYATGGELSAAAKDYEGVRKSFFLRFGKAETPEERIQIAVSSSLDATDFQTFLRGMDSLFQKAGFDENAKFGLLRKAVMEHSDLAQFMLYRNPTNYAALKSGVLSFVKAKETIKVSSNHTSYTPRRVIQRSDVGQRKIEDKVDALATQLSELSLIVRKSRTQDSINPTDLAKVCSYCRESGHFSTAYLKNDNRHTRCNYCGKLGHAESQYFKKQQNGARPANVIICSDDEADVEPLPTAAVTLVHEAVVSEDRNNVIASVKRTADGEALPKQPRPHGIIPVSSLLAPKATPQRPAISQKNKKTKAKRNSVKHGLTQYARKYDVVSELANAGANLRFGQLIRGDGDKAKSDIRRLLARGARVRRQINTTMPSTNKSCPRRLKLVQVKALGLDSEALLDSGAVPNLISEKLWERLSLRFEQNSVGLTVADGQRACSIGTVTDLPISFDNLCISMDFYVEKNPPFDVLIGVPTLEALRGCLDFGLQQVTLFAGDVRAVLPSEYAVVDVPTVDGAGTDSEDFTSDTDGGEDEADSVQEDLIVAFADDFLNKEVSAEDSSLPKSERRELLVLEKINHLSQSFQNDVASILKDSNAIAWSIHDLSPADVPIRHHFELQDNTPIHHRARRAAPRHNEFIRKELDNLLDAGIIVPACGAWSFPVVIANKKDGALRFCVDYRSLNNVMKADRRPLPRIEEIFDDLQGCSVFTTLDLFTGYWQVRMSETCKEMTSFVTRYGTFQFEVVPFGLMNAPSTFQRMMDVILQNVPFARVYIDDVVIFSRSMKEHLEHLRQVFGRLKTSGLKVKLSKCYIAQRKVRLLGHVVEKKGTSVDEEKIAAIKETHTPSTKTELRSFLGLAGYYRRFIKGFAEISSILHAFTSGKGSLSWTKDMESAFQTLKARLTPPPVLQFPDFAKPFIVETDASCVSLGAVLVQKQHDGQPHPIQYASRTMTQTERNYSICERDALAVIFALKKFRVYLLSSIPFAIVTDHQALRYTFQKKDIHGRLARWLDFLAEYDFVIEYRSGKQNVAADFLSRIDRGTTVGEGYDEGDLICTALSAENFTGLEPQLVSVASYLTAFSISHLDPYERQKIRRSTKKFSVWDGSLCRQVRGGLKFIPLTKNRSKILKAYHDDIGHWDSRTTRTLISDRFWWPTMYKEIHDYLKTCEGCQKMTRVPKYFSELRIPLTSLFDVCSIEFAGLLPVTPRRNKRLLVCVEHLTGWPIVCPSSTATASEVIKFVEEHIFLPFGKPRTIVSDNGPCFTATSLKEFMEQNGIKWKTVLAYAPMSNGRAERMVGTMKRSIGKMVYTHSANWDTVVSKALYGYRRRNLATGFSPYELMYGIKPHMQLEYPDHGCHKDSTEEERSVETMALSTVRATHTEKINGKRRNASKSPTFKIGEFVLVARGKSLGANIKWPPFSSKFYGPCLVTSSKHPRYWLTSAHNRHT